MNDREGFEAFLEAAIVFGRAAIHRLQAKAGKHPEWKQRFGNLRGDDAVEFFWKQRNFILKEGPPKVGQIISGNPIRSAAELYYFENPAVRATDTVRRHQEIVATLVRDAEAKFTASASVVK